MTHVHIDGGARIRRRLAVVLAITLALVVVQFVGGLLAGSLTLLADAGHMLSDAGALALALLAAWFAARPSPPRRTFGYQRAEILAALVNGLLLGFVSVSIVREAIARMREPRDVEVVPMFVLGTIGLAGNVVAARVLRHDAHRNLNVRGAYLEVLADMLASMAVLAAAALTAFLGWRRADPVLSLGIALFILPRIALLLREVTDVLMEAAPRGMDVQAVRDAILGEAGAAAVHDLHVWTIASGRVCLSAHVVSVPGADRDRLIQDANRVLRDRFGIVHTTLQVEGEGQADFSGQRSDEPCDPCAPEGAPAARRPGSGAAGG